MAGGVAAGGVAARIGALGGTPNSGVGHAMSMEISGASVLRLAALCGTALCGAAFSAATAAASGAGFSAAIFCETDFSMTRSVDLPADAR